MLLLSGCSVNVKKNDEGQEKNVDIKTPFGEIHVDKHAEAGDTGLPVYPGAREKKDSDEHDQSNANVNLSAFGYGLRVAAVNMSPEIRRPSWSPIIAIS